MTYFVFKFLCRRAKEENLKLVNNEYLQAFLLSAPARWNERYVLYKKLHGNNGMKLAVLIEF